MTSTRPVQWVDEAVKQLRNADGSAGNSASDPEVTVAARLVLPALTEEFGG